MIVASLLLITVAVTLLVVGLAAGSSTLLIASIGASLLAAIALVIGARQAAGRTASAGSPRTPLAVDLDDDPGPAAAPGETGRFAPVDSAGAYTAATPAAATPAAASTVGARAAAADETVVGLEPDPSGPAYPDEARTDEARTDAVHPAAGSAPGHPDGGRAVGDRAVGDRAVGDRTDGPRPGAVPDGSADTEILDRVPEDLDGAATDDPYADFHREQAAAMHHDAGTDRGWSAGDEADDAAGRGAADAVHAAREADARAGAVATPDDPAGVDDDEDPADEPAPQRTQPADAVRVSRMVAEVLVVDGRPRYHLGDCPSLSGRITEPLPVAEAVELGFTPCSMCRPVDRLVTEAIPH